MEVYERIKELRKNTLKMSQAAFGERLGVNRDVINNIENNRLSRPEQKLSLYKLICSEFNISEEWLLNGTGDMSTSNEAEYGALIDRVIAALKGSAQQHTTLTTANGNMVFDGLTPKDSLIAKHIGKTIA